MLDQNTSNTHIKETQHQLTIKIKIPSNPIKFYIHFDVLANISKTSYKQINIGL